MFALVSSRSEIFRAVKTNNPGRCVAMARAASDAKDLGLAPVMMTVYSVRERVRRVCLC